MRLPICGNWHRTRVSFDAMAWAICPTGINSARSAVRGPIPLTVMNS